MLSKPVIVQEKIDGSQFSFRRTINGIEFRSKGAEVVPGAPSSGMFKLGYEWCIANADKFREGWTYRGEFLMKPKHNTLTYSRTPDNNIILFDIDRGDQDYLGPDEVVEEGKRIGLETVRTFYQGVVPGPEFIKSLLENESSLGGCTPEGVVFKQYTEYDTNKKVLMGKYVTEEFKEKHGVEWKAANPGRADVVQNLIQIYKVPARWEKAVQHLRDAGKLTGTPKDIGDIMHEIGADILKEEEAEIKEALFKWAWKQIARGVTNGVPQWYKDKLLNEAFAEQTVPPALNEELRTYDGTRE